MAAATNQDQSLVAEENRANILTFLNHTITTVKKMDTELEEQQASLKYMKDCVKAVVSTICSIKGS